MKAQHPDGTVVDYDKKEPKCICGRTTPTTFIINKDFIVRLCPLCSHLITKQHLEKMGYYKKYLERVVGGNISLWLSIKLRIAGVFKKRNES